VAAWEVGAVVAEAAAEMIGMMEELLVLKVPQIPMIPPRGRSFHGILLR